MPVPKILSHPERLRKSVDVLALIDNCRRVTGDARLGTAVERLIIERELRDLEDASLPASVGRVTSINRELVIPVRKVLDY